MFKGLCTVHCFFLLSPMILNIEVERNAKIKILSQFVEFEPKKGNQIP